MSLGLAGAALSVWSPARAELAPSPAITSDTPTLDLYRNTVSVAILPASAPDYEGSKTYRSVIAPGAVGTIGDIGFTLAGNQLSVDLTSQPHGRGWDFEAGPVVQINTNRTKLSAIADHQIRALGELDTAVELGLYVGMTRTGVMTSPYDRLSFSLGYRRDASGVHDSDVWQPSLTYFTPLSTKSALAIFASADRVGAGYARSYFGVSADQSAASGLPIYLAKAGWKSWTVGAVATRSITGDLTHGWKVVAAATYGGMIGDFADSPLVAKVGSSDQGLVAIGLGYTF